MQCLTLKINMPNIVLCNHLIAHLDSLTLCTSITGWEDIVLYSHATACDVMILCNYYSILHSKPK